MSFDCQPPPAPGPEQIDQFTRRRAIHLAEVRAAMPGSKQRRALLRYHDRGTRLMFIVVWQFEIAEENLAAFEAAYGPNGSWAELFRSSSDYHGTELLRDVYIPDNYLTIDRWSSEDAFRTFRKEHDAAYESLDRSCDALTRRETRIGAYTVRS